MDKIEIAAVLFSFAFGLFIGFITGTRYIAKQLLNRVDRILVKLRKAENETPKTVIPEGTDKEEDQERETQTPQ